MRPSCLYRCEGAPKREKMPAFCAEVCLCTLCITCYESTHPMIWYRSSAQAFMRLFLATTSWISVTGHVWCSRHLCSRLTDHCQPLSHQITVLVAGRQNTLHAFWCAMCLAVSALLGYGVGLAASQWLQHNTIASAQTHMGLSLANVAYMEPACWRPHRMYHPNWGLQITKGVTSNSVQT